MPTTGRPPLTALSAALAVVLFLGATAGSVAAQAPPRPTPAVPAGSLDAAEDEALLASPAPGTEARANAVRQAIVVMLEAWNLLLDRYVEPLEPARLAQAAEDAMSQVVQAAGVALSGDPPSFEGDRYSVWAALTDRYRELAEPYPEIPPVTLAHVAIAAMAAAAEDTHTHFLTPRQYREHLAWTRGEVKYGGIGARLRGPVLTIVEVFDGSPAAGAGLRPGDRIEQVDDTSTEGMRLDEAVNLIRGPEGSQVRLVVRRAGSGRVETLVLQRAEIHVPFVESRRLGDLGYIRLRGFPEPTVNDQVEMALLAFQNDGVRGIVLDLRGNSGGRLDVGSRLLSRFVPEGPIYQEVDRRGRQATRSVRGGQPILRVPLAVLIDEGTASMGEIFAVNIQEHGVGRLFGTTTMGSVAASQVLPLSDGSALQLSVMQIFSGQGQRLNREGVHPDEEVELRLEDLQSGRDPQLERAMAYLRESAARPAATGASPR